MQTAHYSFHLKFHELPVFAKSNHSTVSVVMLTCNVPPQLFTNLSRADGFAQFARDASLLSWRVAPESMLTTETGWERTFLKGVVDSGWLFEKVTKGNAKSCTIQDKVEKVKQRVFCANLLNEYQIRLKKKKSLMLSESVHINNQSPLNTHPTHKNILYIIFLMYAIVKPLI